MTSILTEDHAGIGLYSTAAPPLQSQCIHAHLPEGVRLRLLCSQVLLPRGYLAQVLICNVWCCRWLAQLLHNIGHEQSTINALMHEYS